MTVELKPARLTRVHPNTSNTLLVQLRPERSFLDAYRYPGQYAALGVEGESARYFAVASAPGREPVEFLVKRATALANALEAEPRPETLLLGAPAGAGFPLDRTRGTDLLLFAVGTGISALRPVIQTVLEKRDDWGRVVLYQGARRASELPFADEHEGWRQGGVEVMLTCSREPAEGGFKGYVQDLARSHAPKLTRAHAFVCGTDSMTVAVRETLEELGLHHAHFHTNLD